MRKNHNATPAKANGTPSLGNGKPFANMPANNVGTFPVSLGTTHNSKLQKETPLNGSKHPGKQNMPTHNKPNTSVQLGNTKHGVGEVPAYLKGKN